jgi:hypothetical protein
VNLRLTEEEYQILVRNCLTVRARSICDYARTMLCRQPAVSNVSNENICFYLNDLLANVQAMERQIRQLGAQFASWQKSASEPSQQ